MKPNSDIFSNTNSFFEAIQIMADGNKGTLDALIGLISHYPMSGRSDIKILHSLGLRGNAIWIAFKDECQQDLAAFRKWIMDSYEEKQGQKTLAK